ncbi:MAG TPA: amidase, partial [Gaiellaceae bacterium]|nr:amidase [Gaiellaceae bacterium]
HGVPVSIKDLFDVKGLPTTKGSLIYKDRIAEGYEYSVKRLLDSGAVHLGKTNTPEFGFLPTTDNELFGSTYNPWDIARTSGGSSGGAGSAVAAGLGPLALGSDGGGSIRIPASCCGLVGLKPSRGRVSPAPWGSGSLGLSTNGSLARTVRDAAAFLDVVSGYEPGDFFVAPPPERAFLAEAELEPGRLRIAYTLTPPVEVPVDETCAAAVHEAVALLAELGHDVHEAVPPWTDPDLAEHFIRVWQAGPAAMGIDFELLEPINRALAEDAVATPSPAMTVSLYRLQSEARKLVAFWSDVDVLVTPTLALPPVPIGWTFEDTDGDPRAAFLRQFFFTPFTAVFNVTGQPAMSLPLHRSADGLPIGVHFVGRPFADATLVRLAAQLEQARPWIDYRPPLAERMST